MSLDPVALLRALSRQEDDLLRETVLALAQDARTVAAVVEQAIRARADAGASLDDLCPLSGVRLDLHAALRHLERALHEVDVPPCRSGDGRRATGDRGTQP